MELIAIAIEESDRISKIIKSMAEDSNAFQASMGKHTSALQIARTIGSSPEMIRIYDLVADDMATLAQGFTGRTSELGTSLNEMLRSVVDLRALINKEIPTIQQELDTALDSLIDLSTKIKETRTVVANLREKVLGIQPFTKKVRRAKQKYATALDEYIASITIFISRLESALNGSATE